MYRRNLIILITYLCAAGLLTASATATAASDAVLHTDERSAWIEKMKASPRGPFSRIRWFCNDGTIHPPKEYACRERGGGVQHGEWSADTKALRNDGYYIANVYADLSEPVL